MRVYSRTNVLSHSAAQLHGTCSCRHGPAHAARITTLTHDSEHTSVPLTVQRYRTVRGRTLDARTHITTSRPTLSHTSVHTGTCAWAHTHTHKCTTVRTAVYT